MPEKTICQLCNEEVKSLKALALHINNKHPETDKEQYFIKFLSIDNEHLCKTCGKPNKFRGFAKRCGEYCSTKCMANSPKIQEKRMSTIVDKYGVENISQIEEVKEKKKQINQEKYGVDYNFQAKEVKKKIKETLVDRYGVENPMLSEEFKNKQRETLKNKYNTEFPLQSKEIYEKMISTNLEKYGVKHYSQTSEYKIQIKETNLLNRGVEHQMYSDEVKNKVKQTNLERYGVDNPLSSPEIQNKIKETNLIKFGDIYPLRTETVKNNLKQSVLEKYGVENVFQINEIKEKIKLFNINKMYNKLIKNDRLKNKVTPLFNIDEYIGVNIKNKYKFKCNKCDNIFEDHLDNGRIPRCLKCYPHVQGTSKGEKELYDYVKSITPENKIIIQNDRNIICPLELDIYLPEYNLAIEFNGLYWHSENQGKDKNYHLNKTNLCREQGIQLLHIFEDEWFDKQEIVKSIIKSKMKLISNNIYARNCIIKEVPFKMAEDFLDDNHIQGGVVHGRNIGLFNNDELVSLFTYSKSRFDKSFDWEILRYCNKLETNVVGGFSRLLQYFRKNNNGSIITYSDLRYSYGNVYLKNGFKQLRTSSPNYYYINDYCSRYNRLKFQKHKLKNILENYDENLSEHTLMQINGYDRIWDSGNLVFQVI